MTKKVLSIFVLWIAATSFVLFYWASQSYGYFDESASWVGLNSFPVGDFESTASSSQWIMVHVRDSQCRCNQLAERHIGSTQWPNNTEHQYMNLEEAKRLGWVVPATPMLVMMKADGVGNLQVRYAGPYASGPLCSSDNSFIPSVVSASQSRQEPLWLNGNVKACRCS